MKRKTFQLADEYVEFIEDRSRQLGISHTEVVRRALDSLMSNDASMETEPDKRIDDMARSIASIELFCDAIYSEVVPAWRREQLTPDRFRLSSIDVREMFRPRTQ